MERNEVNGEKLRQMLANRGVRISKGHVSNILKGSRRVSLTLAIELNELTGVSVKALAEWPRKSKGVAKRKSVGRETEIATTV
jgi:plasmid maintenance system antidote protein VapI